MNNTILFSLYVGIVLLPPCTAQNVPATFTYANKTGCTKVLFPTKGRMGLNKQVIFFRICHAWAIN